MPIGRAPLGDNGLDDDGLLALLPVRLLCAGVPGPGTGSALTTLFEEGITALALAPRSNSSRFGGTTGRVRGYAGEPEDADGEVIGVNGPEKSGLDTADEGTSGSPSLEGAFDRESPTRVAGDIGVGANGGVGGVLTATSASPPVLICIADSMPTPVALTAPYSLVSGTVGCDHYKKRAAMSNKDTPPPTHAAMVMILSFVVKDDCETLAATGWLALAVGMEDTVTAVEGAGLEGGDEFVDGAVPEVAAVEGKDPDGTMMPLADNGAFESVL
ncbi:hypothetical protein EIP91_006195 [Steccherinum ochraceum]|uniref:Uncharacterized protein n=1 Tax=Steccherinum ochraceum TaxID=92696 RepID=A0A4R0R8U1_9APHY|nr:hypothetical protein EIP91_006195 [Steccherinum ochraceum]